MSKVRVHISVSLDGYVAGPNHSMEDRLVDEVELHVVPVLLGGGARLFEGVGSPVQLDLLRTIDAPRVSHLKYRVASGGRTDE